ncbi:hypothetical protein HYH08_18200 [Bradyrhizobium sp. BR 10289]|nr:hypothetical protein [Bradyrhizobium sp. BR 10289]
MQVEDQDTICPICGSEGLQRFPIVHHMICAYVGPDYDFDRPDDAAYSCPKCNRAIVSDDPACEIVGLSARCLRCGGEMVVSPSLR